MKILSNNFRNATPKPQFGVRRVASYDGTEFDNTLGAHKVVKITSQDPPFTIKEFKGESREALPGDKLRVYADGDMTYTRTTLPNTDGNGKPKFPSDAEKNAFLTEVNNLP